MKKSIYHLFQTFGEVIDINIKSSQKMRGQAFVVFRDQEMAERALLELN
jgi:RNA recognition motif-containing protein